MSARSAPPPSAAPSDLREVLQTLRHRAGTIFLCVLLTTGLAVAYLHVARPIYASQAVLEVAPASGADADPDSAALLRTLELTVASQSVLLGVIHADHLADDPEIAPPLAPDTEAAMVARLQAKISVELIRGSRLISVTAEDPDPARARLLAQSVVDEFFRESAAVRQQDENAAHARLMAEAQRLGAAATAAEDRLQAYREKHDAVSLDQRQDVVVQRLKDLNSEVAAAKNARLALEPDRAQVLALAKSSPEQLLSLREIASQPDVIDLRREVAEQQARVATLAKVYGPLHPTMIEARSELDDLRTSLNAAIRKAGGLLLQSYAAARATESALESALVGQEQAALQLDQIAIPYHALDREVQADDATYQRVLDELKQADAQGHLLSEYDVDGGRVDLVARPLQPDRPVRPRRMLWLAGAVGAGLMLGGATALAARALDDTVSSVDGAETALGLPVLATVPQSSRRRLGGGPVVVKRPSSIEAEAFRSLRSSLALLETDEERRCVLFTSAIPGEGKSFCSLNYAAALAQQGRRTLLIDGDLRRPQQIAAEADESLLQRMVSGRGSRPGLSEVVRQPDLFARTVQATSVRNLYLLGDSRGRTSAAELLAHDGLKEILRQATAAFDRVVVDSAPILAVSDSLHLARNIPTVCLVVRAGRTPRRLVVRACQLLQEVARRGPTGIVLNKVGRGAAAGYHYYQSDRAYA
jgi:polysaccharide biosynthesis transport protein